MDLEITPGIIIPSAELNWRYSRSSGPGGQNVNKVNSRATLEWKVFSSPSLSAKVKARLSKQQSNRINQEGVLSISSDRYRDQKRNVEDCRDKLKAIVLAALEEPKVRKSTKPTRASVDKRLKEKKQQSERKSLRKRPDY